TVNKLELFTGYCYTQLADTFQEANGLLFADRTPKFPIERIARAVRANSLMTPEAIDLHEMSPNGNPARELDSQVPSESAGTKTPGGVLQAIEERGNRDR